jgi:hypothetical protein
MGFSSFDKSIVVKSNWILPVSNINSEEEWLNWIKDNQPNFTKHLNNNSLFVHKKLLTDYLGKDMLSDLISEDRQKKLEKLGIINSNIKSSLSDYDKMAKASATYGSSFSLTPVDDAEIRQFKYFPRSFILSDVNNRIFTLGDLLQDGGLVAQRGLSEQQIVYNLKQLAINCLDPIKEKYPDMHINSGFRQGTNLSDHGLGAAVDIKFTNRSKTEYKDIAEWIVNNVPHRQVLLEYLFESGSNKLRTVWIHLSFLTSNGALVKSNYAPVQTFVNHSSVYAKLVNLA